MAVGRAKRIGDGVSATKATPTGNENDHTTEYHQIIILVIATYFSFLRFAPFEYKKITKEERRSLTLFQRPLSTLCHFSAVVLEFFVWLRNTYFSNRVILLSGIIYGSVYTASTIGGPEDLHNILIMKLVFTLKFVLWWVALACCRQ